MSEKDRSGWHWGNALVFKSIGRGFAPRNCFVFFTRITCTNQLSLLQKSLKQAILLLGFPLAPVISHYRLKMTTCCDPSFGYVVPGNVVYSSRRHGVGSSGGPRYHFLQHILSITHSLSSVCVNVAQPHQLKCSSQFFFSIINLHTISLDLRDNNIQQYDTIHLKTSCTCCNVRHLTYFSLRWHPA